MGKGVLQTNKLMLTAQKRRVKQWRDVPKNGIVRVCSLELEGKRSRFCLISVGF